MRREIWDVLIEQGKNFGIKPAGILALDVARLEAGFILLEVDYIGAEKAVIPIAKLFAVRDRSRLDGGSCARIISSAPKRCGDANRKERRGKSSAWK